MSHQDSEVTSHEVWPSKLNKLIIGAGVIAFGLIIVDRVSNIFRANELPEPLAIERPVETALVVESTSTPETDNVEAMVPANEPPQSAVADVDNDEETTVEPAIADVDLATVDVAEGNVESADSAAEVAKDEPTLDIEEIFGSPLVFVSAAEPLFVLTEEEVRYGIGNSITEEMTLAGITDKRVILEKGGELLVVDLPNPGE